MNESERIRFLVERFNNNEYGLSLGASNVLNLKIKELYKKIKDEFSDYLTDENSHVFSAPFEGKLVECSIRTYTSNDSWHTVLPVREGDEALFCEYIYSWCNVHSIHHVIPLSWFEWDYGSIGALGESLKKKRIEKLDKEIESYRTNIRILEEKRNNLI